MDPTIHWYLVECAGRFLVVLTVAFGAAMLLSVILGMVYVLCLLSATFDPTLCRHCGKPVTDSPPEKIRVKDF
jgi:hypothetical protein